MNGQGLAGLIVSLSSLFTIWAAQRTDLCEDDSADDSSCETDISYSALAYFTIAACVLGSCVGLFLLLMKLSATK